MIITLIPRDAIETVWPDAAELLKPSVRVQKETFHIVDLYELCINGYYNLWMVFDEDNTAVAAITTRVIRYPNRKSLSMDWIGGTRINEWLPMAQDVLSSYARDMNCKQMEGYGRKGWGRILQKHGWGQNYIAWRMELDEEDD